MEPIQILVDGLLSPSPSDPAYLDPGSGSLILQVLISSILGGLLIFRNFFAKLFGRGKNQDAESDLGEHTEEHEE